ncbi:MAG: hypothetical protein MI920_39150 [Kiloniellales bacterium]|nr:hypothetical protein [Kiloniellales bacterium]
MRLLSAFVILVLAALPVSVQAAQDLAIEAFYGQWKGSGISKNPNSVYFGITERDFDVMIQAKGGGFSVTWTTVLRQGGDPNNPNVKRNTASKDFVPSGNGRFFVSPPLPDPLSGKDYAWARIEKSSLYVYILTIDEAGVYDMQVYERTLLAPGMSLKFTRIRGDEPQRTVEGRLVKFAD